MVGSACSSDNDPQRNPASATTAGTNGVTTTAGTGGATAIGGTSGATATGGASTAQAGAAGLQSQPGALVSYLGDPAYPDDFWTTATLQESNMDAAVLERAVERIAGLQQEIHSFLVARYGRIVFERYGWKSGSNLDDPDKTPHQVVPTERHLIHSTTKSITSTLVGIAIRDRLIAGVDDLIVPHFPEYQPLPEPSPDKDAITLEDLLTMRSGLQWAEGVDDQAVFFDSSDPAKTMLSRPVVDAPVGAVWNYNTGACDIISALLRKVTGTTPLDYANLKLFGPLGLKDVVWQAASNGTNYGGWGLQLTAREMTRFGELYRNRGLWNGEQIVPAEWTDVATTSKCQTPWSGQYGYLFWIPNVPGVFGTRGAFGQNIYVSRALGLVVAFTADLPMNSADSELDIIVRDMVIPAAK
jgi:CubicO group peptidase (beta-lactamase class C family)